jgi:hypothetical protein
MTEPQGETPPETPTETVTPPEPAAQPAQDPPTQPGKDWKAEADKWRHLSQETERKSRENAKRIKDIEDRDLSDLDRAKKEIAELTDRATTAERARLRADVALAKGLPADVVSALTGDTPEELTAAADALIKWRGSAVPAVPTAPRPDPSQGAHPVSQTSANEAEWQQYRALVFPNQ